MTQKKTRRRLMDRKIIEYLRSRRSLKAISRELHVGKCRIRRLREQAKEYGYLNEDGDCGDVLMPVYPEALFPDPVDKRMLKISEPHQQLGRYHSWIEDRLKTGWHKVTVYEELPIKIGRSSFYRYLDRHHLSRLGEKIRARVVPEIIHGPGEALILDWGKLRDVVDPATGKKKTLWAFVGILGYSRYLMVRLVWNNKVGTTLQAIESFFQETGGVPFKLTSDNPKCFSLSASKYEPILNPAYERFGSHYGCVMECLPPRDPQKKGKVERMMPYIRRLYEAYGNQWEGLLASQAYLNQKLILANQRKHGTTRRRPLDVLKREEASKLKELPCLSYEIDKVHEGGVRKDGHVRFDNKYYSVDEKYMGKEVVVLGNSEQVSIYHEGKLIEVHARITDPHQTKSTKEHHLKPWERCLQDHSVYRKRARKIGVDVEKMIVAILEKGQGFIDTRKVWGILSLDKAYSKEQINEACKQAYQWDSLSYHTIKRYLRLRDNFEKRTKKIQNTSEFTNQNRDGPHKFVRDLSAYQNHLLMLMNPTTLNQERSKTQ